MTVQPVKIVTASELEENGGVYLVQKGIAAMPVYGLTEQGNQTPKSNVIPVYVVSEAEFNAGDFVKGHGHPVNVGSIEDLGINRAVEGRAAIPVYAVNEWPSNAPNAPTNLTATAVSSTQINLSWTDTSGDEAGFNIYRDSVLIDTVAADETTYEDTGLTANTTYEYYVTAFSGDGESDPSNTASATTGVIITLQPNAAAGIDTYLDSNNPTTNFGTSADMIERQADYRSLIKFDLSSIPAGSTIVSATYSLWTNFVNATNVTINVHRVKAANSGWTEAGATWNTIEGATAWAGSAGCSTSGTDYETTPLGTFNFIGGTPAGSEVQASLNTTQMEALLTTNYGWVGIRPAAGNPLTTWRTSDHAVAALRPKLVIEYIAP